MQDPDHLDSELRRIRRELGMERSNPPRDDALETTLRAIRDETPKQRPEIVADVLAPLLLLLAFMGLAAALLE